MRRLFLLTLLSAAALIAISVVPAVLFSPGAAGLEASAANNLNSSKSNLQRAEPKSLPKKSLARPGRGGPAGLAVSDPGSPADKPSKGKGKK